MAGIVSLEKKDANVIWILQLYQADKPMFDRDFGIMNELRARIAGMEVVGCINQISAGV